MSLSIGHLIGLLGLSTYNAFGVMKALRLIHRWVLNKLLHAPISWFDSTPSGRILSRFSGDMSQADHTLITLLDDLQQFLFLLISCNIIIAFLIPAIVPIMLF